MEENKRDFKGIWIPKEIWLSEDLTVMEKIFLVEINSLDNEDGCFASNTYFADFFGLSNSRVSEIINSLVKKKYINSKIHRKGKQIMKRTLSVNTKNLFGKGVEPIRKRQRTYSEKAIDNNTVNNTSNKRKKSVFVPPTLEDIEKYVIDNELDIDSKYFLKYFTEGKWIDSKGNKVKNWKQKLLTWSKYGTKKKSSGYLTDAEADAMVERVMKRGKKNDSR